jgi:hypothetical protein
LSDEEILAPLPPAPEFHEPIEAVHERIANVVGKLTVPRDITIWHPAIDRLLQEDDKRRERQLAAHEEEEKERKLKTEIAERERQKQRERAIRKYVETIRLALSSSAACSNAHWLQRSNSSEALDLNSVMSPMSPSFDLQPPHKHQKMGIFPGSSMVEHSAVHYTVEHHKPLFWRRLATKLSPLVVPQLCPRSHKKPASNMT